MQAPASIGGLHLRNRGLRDILILCCDGLSGLPEAITSVFPDTVVQTCVVRNAMRFVSYQDRKKIAAGMRTIYTAPSVEAAELALKDLDADWGRQYPGVIDVWRRVWNEFIPFLDYPVELRRVVYTTNSPGTSLRGRSRLHGSGGTFRVERSAGPSHDRMTRCTHAG